MTGVAEPRFPFVQVAAPAERAEELGLRLFELGASGVETRDDTTTPRGPGGGRVLVVASFDARDAADAAAEDLARAAPDLAPEVGEIVGDAWRDAYKQFFAPFALTPGVVVVPPWVEGFVAEPGQRVLWMDPGRAFGTGLHATTRLVAEALERHRAELAGARVLDVGTGSGILALVALLAGAADAVAIDNDPEVLDVARENAERNGLAARIAVSDAPLEAIAGTFSAVVANIRADTLIAMAPALRARLAPNGLLVLSGILAGERDDVVRAFEAAGCALRAAHERGEDRDASGPLRGLPTSDEDARRSPRCGVPDASGPLRGLPTSDEDARRAPRRGVPDASGPLRGLPTSDEDARRAPRRGVPDAWVGLALRPRAE